MGKKILLLGAGFSRNWGGWLASEAFEYLLGCPQIDDGLRALLLQHKDKGFEAALEALQSRGPQDKGLQKFEDALRSMFEAMNRGFQAVRFESHESILYTVGYFLRRFDAIFTLNQDCLLEMHYLSDRLFLEARDRWKGYVIPGMVRVGEPNWANPAFVKWKPSGELPKVPEGYQPYIKLHGSSEWETEARSLIMGANKSAAIRNHPILAWGMKAFEDEVAQPQTRLMVIGYSFRDDHINSAIERGVEGKTTTLFVVDPQGIDAINQNAHGGLISAPSALSRKLWPHVRGSSRRQLATTFATDRAEHAKLMRFLND